MPLKAGKARDRFCLQSPAGISPASTRPGRLGTRLLTYILKVLSVCGEAACLQSLSQWLQEMLVAVLTQMLPLVIRAGKGNKE